MRILLTTDTVGGVWTFTQELATGLLERGCEVALFSLGRMPSQARQHWVARMQQHWQARFCFRCSSAPLEWMQHNDRAYSEAEPALLALVETFAPDLLHASQFCFGALPVDVPKIVTAHSDVLSWAAHCRQQPLPPTPWLAHYIHLVSRGLAAADAVIAPTRWMLGVLAENFALPRHRAVIANGRTLPASIGGPRTLQAVTAGRLWDEAKNLRLLEDVKAPIPILVAGEQSHEGMAAPASIGSARLLGAFDEDAIVRLFQSSSIYVCLSRYEPFGLAPLEAAWCGCAVVANDLASLREVWGDAAVYFNDAASLSAVLSDLAGNPLALQRMQRRAYAQAQRYTRAAMTSRYLAIYRERTAHPGRGRDVA